MRHFLVVLGLFALALLAQPAAAASFDCARAATPLEKAVCADPELSAADDAMAKAFGDARKRLSPIGSGVVLENQRAWLGYAERACTTDAQPMVAGQYDADGIDCLENLYANRAVSLDAIGAVGGMSFYPVEFYETVPDPYPDSWVKVATTEISFAQRDAEGAEAEAFNAFVYRLAAPALSPKGEEEEPGTSDYALTISVNLVTPNLIGVGVDEYFYGHGAAHGNYALSFGNFLRDEARELVAEDVFKGEGWSVDLVPLVVQSLERETREASGEENVLWEDLTGLDQSIADPTRWSIQDEGIAFQFQPYEVTAYAYGAPKALLTWEELEPWLVPGIRQRLLGA